jgi:hypothetical protein
MNIGQGWLRSLAPGVFLGSLAVLLLLPACAPGPQSNEELRKEIQGLKSEVTSLNEKLAKLEAGQQTILDLLKKSGAPPPEVAGMPETLPPRPQVLTVDQLLAAKDRYLGARVTVKGQVGPVLVHHKSLLLKSPHGLVEVFFGRLPDEKQVTRLTSTTLDQPITVTGVVGPSPQGGAKLQIQAEAVEF